MAIVLSFDIDGTLEVGDPPGGITIAMVRRAIELGYLVGSCSDWPLSGQRALWAENGIEAAFVCLKHRLEDVRTQVAADAYFHVGDRDLDQRMAEQAGFGFWWAQEAVGEPWLALLEMPERARQNRPNIRTRDRNNNPGEGGQG